MNAYGFQYFSYNVYGQVIGVYANSAQTIPLIEYIYDDRVQRLQKIDYLAGMRTCYVRDAAGNVMSVF